MLNGIPARPAASRSRSRSPSSSARSGSEVLKTVEFDYLVPWGASAGGSWYSPADPAKLDAVIERLRRGEDR